MTKRQIIILSALGIFVVLVVLFGIFGKNLRPFFGEGNISEEEVEKMLDESGKSYIPEVPRGAEVSEAKLEAPASTNKDSDAKSLFFDIKATRDGFNPSSITVNKGDNVQIDFMAVDSDYDLDIPYLGVYFAVVKKGMTKRLPFDTNLPGTFLFTCRDYCPSSGTIKGELIVLP